VPRLRQGPVPVHDERIVPQELALAPFDTVHVTELEVDLSKGRPRPRVAGLSNQHRLELLDRDPRLVESGPEDERALESQPDLVSRASGAGGIRRPAIDLLEAIEVRGVLEEARQALERVSFEGREVETSLEVLPGELGIPQVITEQPSESCVELSLDQRHGLEFDRAGEERRRLRPPPGARVKLHEPLRRARAVSSRSLERGREVRGRGLLFLPLEHARDRHVRPDRDRVVSRGREPLELTPRGREVSTLHEEQGVPLARGLVFLLPVEAAPEELERVVVAAPRRERTGKGELVSRAGGAGSRPADEALEDRDGGFMGSVRGEEAREVLEDERVLRAVRERRPECRHGALAVPLVLAGGG
jgi:hypothetical protein